MTVDKGREWCYGVYTMKQQLSRVQVYLDPADVALVDELSAAVGVRRSQVIRHAVGAVAMRYIKTGELVKAKNPKRNPLLDLVGIGESATGTVGLNIDEMYTHD